jgi:programmed cell death 6-interacting protein
LECKNIGKHYYLESKKEIMCVFDFLRYYDQLVSLESKIPSSEVNFPFKWRDAFDRGGIFSGRMSLSIPTIAFERVCVLFNIAALNSM